MTPVILRMVRQVTILIRLTSKHLETILTSIRTRTSRKAECLLAMTRAAFLSELEEKISQAEFLPMETRIQEMVAQLVNERRNKSWLNTI